MSRLSNTRLQRLVREFLDEIDMQSLRDKNPCPSFNDRSAMFRYVNSDVIGAEPIDYLEFGVHRGESLREWTALNTHSQSRFYGFDSFEGLPEHWRGSQGPGHFSLNGNIPSVDDSRIAFIKGWFDQTVPKFADGFVPTGRVVVHLDADLYSSTMIPLVHLNRHFKKGTLMLFDEFYDRNHEFKAFQDYLKISRAKYRPVAQTENYGKFCVAIEENGAEILSPECSSAVPSASSP